MIYLTYADPPSGVFSSQVSDVVNYLNKNMEARIRLVAFISMRNFSAGRKKIKAEVTDAIVMPMIPKANYWKFSSVILFFICLLMGESVIIARGVLACNVALLARKFGLIKKICYDGRGAIAAEWEEYKIAPYPNLVRSIEELEKRAVLQTDFRIAVSAKLTEYWKERFGYGQNNNVIIPCTLNSEFTPEIPEQLQINSVRSQFGFQQDDIMLVYSGSAAGWQSFGLLKQLLIPVLNESRLHKVLFLSSEDENIKLLIADFPGQVKCSWVEHKNIHSVLSACDYGILIREKSITNRVAAPTKFAEYLSAGLKVLISESIGDYPEFVKIHHCGQIIAGKEKIYIEKTSKEEKQRIAMLASQYFSKLSQAENYRKLITTIN